MRFTWLTGGNDGLQKFTADLEKLNPIGTAPLQPRSPRRFNELRPVHHHLRLDAGGAVRPLFVYYLMRSPWGRVLKSIREDEDAARSLGKNIFTYKMQSLIIGGIIGAFGGMVIAVGNQVAQPNNFSTALTFFAYTDPHPGRRRRR